MIALSMIDFHIINRFLEDSCVLGMLGYLLSRGQFLTKLFDPKQRWRDQLGLALVFGLIGGSELLFPGDRYPYVPYTLAAAFAGFAGGWIIGGATTLVLAGLAFVGATFGVRDPPLLLFVASSFAASVVGGCIGSYLRQPRSGGGDLRQSITRYFAGAAIAGALGEAPHALFLLAKASMPLSVAAINTLYSVGSNAFGSIILGLVLWDANQRRIATIERIESERELSSLRLSQLSELQARLHPHFLFNALAGIAGSCVVNPSRAEQAVTELAALLRQLLHAPAEITVPLSEELDLVRTYVDIEQLRLGDRLRLQLSVPPELMTVQVPRFCLQVPVENAVQHGIAPARRLGCIAIEARAKRGLLFIAVRDDGIGVTSTVRSEINSGGDRPHGLSLLAARLTLAYGSRARLRLFSRAGAGVICALRLPYTAPSK